MKFVRKGHKVGRIKKDGMEERGGCLWAGIFGTESAARKRGGSRNLLYLNVSHGEFRYWARMCEQ